MGRALGLLCPVRTVLSLTLILATVVGATAANGTSTATNPALTFHFSHATCATQHVHSITKPLHTPPTPMAPHCTLSVRILLHSPHPSWHAVHNSTVMTAASPSYFRYRIPATQRHCHHQTVLRCLSSHSNHQLAVVPAAGFFYAPSARRPSVDTFVILGPHCSLTTLSDTPSLVRMSGFCLPADKQPTAADTFTALQQPGRNLSHHDVCPVPASLPPTPPSAAESPGLRLRPPRQVANEQKSPHSPTLSSRLLGWLYEQSRSARTELIIDSRTSGQQWKGDRDKSSLHALPILRSWLLVLSGASVCSAAVVLWLIVRLTKRIEMS